MNEILLHGDLREKFGESFKMDVSNPVEAFRALKCQLSGFEGMIRSGEWFVVREMPNGVFALDEQSMFLGMNNCKLHILPSVEGASSKGGIKAVFGIVLIGAALFVPGLQPFLGTAMPLIGGTVKAFAILTGLAFALGGLSLLLAPTPKLDTGKGDNDQSYLIGGNFNPAGQNFAVPIVCGEWRVRGIPVASEIVTEEYFVRPGGTYDNPYNGDGGGSFPNVDGFGGSGRYENHVREV